MNGQGRLQHNLESSFGIDTCSSAVSWKAIAMDLISSINSVHNNDVTTL
jgi:hypothetical protein